MAFDTALDELYAVPPEEFMARRDSLAKELKATGDKAGAAELKRQHKPTLVAHALNRLARDARPQLEALFEAGSALASGKDFKASLDRQRIALEAVKQKAAGPDVPAIIAVVQGALVDEKLAAAVRAGRFSKLPEVPVGFFGAAPEGAAPVVLPPKPVEPPKSVEPPPPLPKPERDEALERELKEAEQEAAAAAEEVRALERELADARHRAHVAAEKAARLRSRAHRG
jgi:hypothetical protein